MSNEKEETIIIPEDSVVTEEMVAEVLDTNPDVTRDQAVAVLLALSAGEGEAEPELFAKFPGLGIAYYASLAVDEALEEGGEIEVLEEDEEDEEESIELAAETEDEEEPTEDVEESEDEEPTEE